MSALLIVVTAGLRGADTRPVVGPGATKDEVVNAYGWPNGQSQSGAKEILSYPQGRIVLENGRVERIDFSPNAVRTAPKPRPAPPSPTSVKQPEAPLDFWLTSLPDAMREAMRRQARILALFTGSDWSPPSKLFQDEVALHPDFVNAVTGDFVFLKIDFPTRAPLPVALREQNAKLRAEHAVTTYPSLIVLSPQGQGVARIDLSKSRPGSYREQVIAAIAEVRELLVAQPPAREPVVPTGNDRSAEPKSVGAGQWLSRGIESLRGPLGVWAGVAVIVVAGGWWLWRRRQQESAAPEVDVESMSAEDTAAWPHDRLCAATALLFEAMGHNVERRPRGRADLVLRRRGDARARVLVCCRAAASGAVSDNLLRELLGQMSAEGVEAGWIVGMGGFAPEAIRRAAERGLVLIDSKDFLQRLRSLSTVARTRSPFGENG